MGYVPPRWQRANETDAEYVAYLEGMLRRQTIMQLSVIPIGLAIFVVVVLAGVIRW